MRAMILAAGRGSRLRPLTDKMPKPLIPVGGKPLIEYHLEALAAIGIKDVVINVSYLAELIMEALGNGEKWGLNIHFSIEDPALEVGGGIFNALPLLGQQPFIVMNGDIFTDFPLDSLPQEPIQNAHLVLVDNPSHNLKGDFGLKGHTIIFPEEASTTLTYSGVGVFRPEFFAGCPGGKFPLAPFLLRAISHSKLTGEHYSGFWSDCGILEHLKALEQMFNPCQ